MRKKTIISLFILFLVIVVTVNIITSADDFEFVPDGGDTIFQEVVEEYDLSDSLVEILSWEKDYEGWREYFENQSVDGTNILEALEEDVEELEYLGKDRRAETLLRYLQVNFPIPEEDRDEDISEVNLPPSGREYVLDECGVCHGMGITFTRDYDFNRWRVLLNSRDHQKLVSDNEQKEYEMAYYLSINEPIPDLVPESWLESLPGY
ncbi:MAG: hypothetical protein ACQEQG_08945 [Bacillota bacterium]